MDYATLLYNPIYDVLGVSATLLPAGRTGAVLVTVVDKTTGIDVSKSGDINLQTIKPVAAVRAVELAALGVKFDELPDAYLIFSGSHWRVESYKLVPSPKGEGDGEVLLILSDQAAVAEVVDMARISIVNMRVYNNEDWLDAFKFTPLGGDTPWDFTEQNFLMQLKSAIGDAVVLELSDKNGRIIVDSVEDRLLHFKVEHEEIREKLPVGEYVYDLLMIEGATESDSLSTRRLMSGTVTVVDGVTREESETS